MAITIMNTRKILHRSIPLQYSQHRRWASALLSCMLLLSTSIPAQADKASALEEQAKQRFARGIELYNEHSYEAALAEFQRAYELSPNAIKYVFLYKIGLLQQKLGDFSGAFKSFTKYLKDGEANVKSERQKEVETRLSQLQSRIASLEIKPNTNDVQVSLDDEPVDSFQPTTPVLVNPGRHKIVVSKSGYEPVTKIIHAVGDDKLTIVVEMIPIKSTPVTPEPPRVKAPIVPLPPQTLLPNTTPIESKKQPTDWAPIVSWIATGLVGGVALTTGIISLSKSKQLQEKRDSTAALSDELSSLRQSSYNYALATDILAGTTILGIGVSLFLTLRSPKYETPKTKDVSFNVGLGSVGVTGRF